jgi:uncharacterized membrane protein YbhN (UPF0104 family)
MTNAPEDAAGRALPRQTRRSTRSWAGPLVSVGLTLAFLAWLGARHAVPWSAVRDQAIRSDVVLLAAVFAGSAVFHVFVGAHKLHCVLRAVGVDIRFGETLKLRLGAGPMRALLPLSAGELIQVLYFRANKQMPLTSASGVLAFDKGMNFLGALAWFLLGVTLAPLGTVRLAGAVDAKWLGLLPAGLIVLALAAIFLVRAHNLAARAGAALHPGLGAAIANLLGPFRELPAATKLGLACYGVIFQLRPIVVCYFLLRAVGLRPSMVDGLAAGSAAVCAGYVPGFAAGSGPREAVLVESLRAGYAPVDAIFCAGILMTLAVHIVPAFLGAPWTFWLLTRLRRVAHEEVAP